MLLWAGEAVPESEAMVGIVVGASLEKVVTQGGSKVRMTKKKFHFLTLEGDATF